MENLGLRFYSPEMGRWASRDPIGEKGGVGLYSFGNNQPINVVDPFGAESVGIDMGTSMHPVGTDSPAWEFMDIKVTVTPPLGDDCFINFVQIFKLLYVWPDKISTIKGYYIDNKKTKPSKFYYKIHEAEQSPHMEPGRSVWHFLDHPDAAAPLGERKKGVVELANNIRFNGWVGIYKICWCDVLDNEGKPVKKNGVVQKKFVSSWLGSRAWWLNHETQKFGWGANVDVFTHDQFKTLAEGAANPP